jgi:hypothetical protein
LHKDVNIFFQNIFLDGTYRLEYFSRIPKYFSGILLERDPSVYQVMYGVMQETSGDSHRGGQ